MSTKKLPFLARRGPRYIITGTFIVLLVTALLNLLVLSVGKWALIEDIERIPKDRVGLAFATAKYDSEGMVRDAFLNRVQATNDLYSNDRVSEILISGEGEEVEVMRAALLEKGIPESVLLVDYEGSSTLNSILRARKAYKKEKLVMVSQPYQLRRAVFIAKAYQIDAIGYPAPNPNANFSEAMIHFGEMFRRVGTIMECYVLRPGPSSTQPSQPMTASR